MKKPTPARRAKGTSTKSTVVDLEYEFVRRDPLLGYMDNNLWIPKAGTNVPAVLASLTFNLPTGEKLCLGSETETHLIVPRHYLDGQNKWFELIDDIPMFEKVVFADLGVVRPNQQAAWDSLKIVKNGTLNLACGKGKTFLALKKIALIGHPAIVIVNQGGTLKQWAEAAEMFLGETPTVIQADKSDWSGNIVLATIQTLSKRAGTWPLEMRRRFGMVVVDECFVAGTLVDGTPIENVVAGDLVTSYDESTGAIVTRPVVRSMRNTARVLVRITTTAGRITCTLNHPFLTVDGWVAAGALIVGMLVCDAMHQVEADDHGRSYMSKLQPARQIRYEGAAGQGAQERESLLLGRVHEADCISRALGEGGGYEQEVRIPADDQKEPDECTCCTGEAAHELTRNGVETTQPRGERVRPHSPTAAARLRSGVGDGGFHQNRRGSQKGRASHSLRVGYSEQGTEDRHKGGRRVTLQSESTGERQEERRVPTRVRVEGVEVLEQGSADWPGRRGEPCVVYNLEVEGTHTYTANGIVVHNCHHMSAPKFSLIADMFFGNRLGLTATPKRADGTEVVYYQHLGGIFFSDMTQELTPTVFMQEMSTDMDLASPKVLDCFGKLHIQKMRIVLETDLVRIARVITHLKKAIDAGRKILVLGHSVDGLTLLAERATAALGMKVGLITGDTGLGLRMGIFRDNQVVVASVGVAAEALDAPALDTIMFYSPFRPGSKLIQGVGRILRAHSGKKDPVVVVFVDKKIPPCRGLSRSLQAALVEEGYRVKLAGP